MNQIPDDDGRIPDPEPGKVSVRLGTAFLTWIDKEHLGLFRRVVTVVNNGGELERTEHPQPVGPLGVYREARRGDRVDMRTNDPRDGRPMELTVVWKPGMPGGPS